MLTAQPGPRDRRLLSALLVLGVVAVLFYIVSQLTVLFFYFGDIFLTFFLAWLLAFIISPIVTRIIDTIPRLPRAVAGHRPETARRGARARGEWPPSQCRLAVALARRPRRPRL